MGGFNISGRTGKEHGLKIFEQVMNVGKLCVCIIVVFATAFIAALIGSFVDMLLQTAQIDLPGDWPVRYWMWIGGAIIGAVGYPLGWITINGKKFSFSRNDENEEQEIESEISSTESKVELPAKVIPTAGFFCLVGSFLGLFVGGSLLLVWFSLSMSPWPPEGWLESVSAKAVDLSAPRGSLERDGGMTTQNPIAIYCFVGPIAILGLLGFFVGGIGAACGWVKDVNPDQPK